MDVVETGKNSEVISAIVALNRMHGYDAPAKVEHSGTGIRLVIEGVEPGARLPALGALNIWRNACAGAGCGLIDGRFLVKSTGFCRMFVQEVLASKSPNICNRNPLRKGHFMTTTLKALEDRLAAESRLISAGVLSPMRRSPQDAEWEAAWTKACQESIRTGLPTRLDFRYDRSLDQDQT